MQARFLGGPWHWQTREVDGRPYYYVRVTPDEPPRNDPAELALVRPRGREWRYKRHPDVKGLYILEHYGEYMGMHTEKSTDSPMGA